MAAVTPFALWRTNERARRYTISLEPHASSEAETADTFETWVNETWVNGSLDTWTGRRQSKVAAIEILPPLAAVAVGMTALGIVFEIAQRNQI